MTGHAGWELPDPADVIVLSSDDDWRSLYQRYPSQLGVSLERCLAVAQANGATTAVIETRYIDLDYRSEFSAFYSRTFQDTPDSAHRIHFFRAALTRDSFWKLPPDPGYVGYIVIRPSELGRVGRTMLLPPPGRHDAIRTKVRHTVNYFGHELVIEAAPFAQQDSQLGRCAHAAAWMCHFAGHLRGDVSRRSMAEFSLSADPNLGYGRELPSEGLTDRQLLALFRLFGLPPAFYNVQYLPASPNLPWTPPPPEPPPEPEKQHPGWWDTRLIATCCRYLNSGLPVLVCTTDHTFVLTGYERRQRDNDRDWITFYRHDDQRGPYLPVENVLLDIDPATGFVYSPWEAMIVPLPNKLWLPPEPAERKGGEMMAAFAERLAPAVPDAAIVKTLVDRDRLALRTYAIRTNRFKRELAGRVPTEVEREYRLARFSRFIWVVEAIDRERRNSGVPSVMGEAVFDATSSEHSPRALAVHVPGIAWVGRTRGRPRFPIRCAPDAYASGGIGPP